MTATLVADDMLEFEIRRILVTDAGPIHDLAVVAISGRIRLYGVADSYVEKRRAEEFARRIDGVRDVINQLRVIPG